MVTKAEKVEARERLRGYLAKPGRFLYSIPHVARSGMSRVIRIHYMTEDGSLYYLSRNIALALGWSYDRKHEGVRVQGCGMDMVFHTLETLSGALYNPGDKYDREAHFRLTKVERHHV